MMINLLELLDGGYLNVRTEKKYRLEQVVFCFKNNHRIRGRCFGLMRLQQTYKCAVVFFGLPEITFSFQQPF